MKLQTYLFSYPYQGAQYSIEIVAGSLEEAQGRVKALAWAKYEGELHARIPAAVGWWVPLWVWWKNNFSTTA